MTTQTISTGSKTSAIAERLAASARLRKRRYELLPLVGTGAVFTDVQGRAPGDATSEEGLAELISSIGTVGVLQPILVEELPHGAHLLVAGERRLRACRLGAVKDPDNPHFHAIPAVVCPGPLAPDERQTWQLIENLARTDLQPGELAAALVFERCALLSVRLESAGAMPPNDVLSVADPMQRWTEINKFRKTSGNNGIGASWHDVIQRLGLQFSEDKVVQLVRAFKQMPPEVSEEMDEHSIKLSARLTYIKLSKSRHDAAEELWDAVKQNGNVRLLGRAAQESLDHPDIEVATAVERAEEIVREANEARSSSLKSGDEDLEDAPAVSVEILSAAIKSFTALIKSLKAGATLGTYDKGSIRLYLDELNTFVDPSEKKVA